MGTKKNLEDKFTPGISLITLVAVKRSFARVFTHSKLHKARD